MRLSTIIPSLEAFREMMWSSKSVSKSRLVEPSRLKISTLCNSLFISASALLTYSGSVISPLAISDQFLTYV